MLWWFSTKILPWMIKVWGSRSTLLPNVNNQSKALEWNHCSNNNNIAYWIPNNLTTAFQEAHVFRHHVAPIKCPSEPLEHWCSEVPRGLRGPLTGSHIMPRGESLSGRRCRSFQSGMTCSFEMIFYVCFVFAALSNTKIFAHDRYKNSHCRKSDPVQTEEKAKKTSLSQHHGSTNHRSTETPRPITALSYWEA